MTLAAITFVVRQIVWQDQITLVGGKVVYGWIDRDEVGATILRGNDGQVYAAPATDITGAPAVTPGFLSLIRRVKFGYFLLSIVLFVPVVLLQSLRWRWLLQTHHADPGMLEAIRLTWIGLLANNIFPGSTGGDLIKGLCIARRTPERRVEAFMSVLMDRVMGLVGLLILGGFSLMLHSRSDARMASAAQWVGIMLLIVLISGCLYFSARVRRVLRIEQLIDMLPLSEKLHRLDQSIYHYRHHLPVFAWCIAMSIFLQGWAIVSVWMVGLALGVSVSIVYYFLLMPIIITLAAFFPSIGGLGVMEFYFHKFFTEVGTTPAEALAMCVLYRLSMLIVSAFGSVAAYREFSAHGIPANPEGDGDLAMFEEVAEEGIPESAEGDASGDNANGATTAPAPAKP